MVERTLDPVHATAHDPTSSCVGCMIDVVMKACSKEDESSSFRSTMSQRVGAPRSDNGEGIQKVGLMI